MHAPTPKGECRFTHPLSFDEQRLLNPEQQQAYSIRLMERPVRQRLDVNSDAYLDGDYAKHGTMQATEWGE